MVAFIYIMIYNIKHIINYIKKQRNENMLNNEWRRWQGKGKCSLTMKGMKLGTREYMLNHRVHPAVAGLT